jgi:hypothetical protein
MKLLFADVKITVILTVMKGIPQTLKHISIIKTRQGSKNEKKKNYDFRTPTIRLVSLVPIELRNHVHPVRKDFQMK